MSAPKTDNRKRKRGADTSSNSTSNSSELQLQQHKTKTQKGEHSKSKSKQSSSQSAVSLSVQLPSVSSLIHSAKDDLERLISYRDFGKDLYDKAAQIADKLIAQQDLVNNENDDDAAQTKHKSKKTHKDKCHVCGVQIAKRKYALPCGQMVDGGFSDFEQALNERGGCGKICHINCMQRTKCQGVVLCEDCVDDYDCIDCDECAGY